MENDAKKTRASYLPEKDLSDLQDSEKRLSAALRNVLTAKPLGDVSAFYATLLAEYWSTLTRIAESIERFSREKGFMAAFDREPVDFFTEMHVEIDLLKSRTAEVEHALEKMLAVYYRETRDKKSK